MQKTLTVTIVIIGIIVAMGIAIYTLTRPTEIVNPISVSTDKDYYESGNPATILVTVHVTPQVYKEEELVELQIVDANRTQYTFQPLGYDQPGVNVTYPLRLGGQEVASGEYWVLASYRGFDAQTSFEYEGFKTNAVSCHQFSLCTYQLKVGYDTYPINFRMNGTVENMVAEPESATLTITIQPPENPIGLQIAIPREVIDSKANPEDPNSQDVEFAVFVDEENVAPDEIPIQAREWTIALGISDNPEKYRILIIPIDYDSVTVEIVGTWLI